MGSDYQLGTFFDGPRARRLDYRVTSHVELQRARAADSSASAKCSAPYRRESSPRARALAESWLTDGPSGTEIVDARHGLPTLATVPVHADAARARRTARRRVPVRDARRLLRALRFRADLAAARRGPAGARRHGLPGRRVQRDRRLLHRATVRRACLDRSLARGRRLGPRRRRRRGRTGARGARASIGFGSGGATAAAAALRASWGRQIALLWDAVEHAAGKRGSSATARSCSARCSSRLASTACAACSAPPCCSGSR